MTRKLDILGAVFEVMELLVTGFAVNRSHSHEHDWLKAAFVNAQAVHAIVTVTLSYRAFLSAFASLTARSGGASSDSDVWKHRVLSGALRVVPALLELEADPEGAVDSSASSGAAAAAQSTHISAHQPLWMSEVVQVLLQAVPIFAASAGASSSNNSNVLFLIGEYYRNDTQAAVEAGIFEVASCLTPSDAANAASLASNSGELLHLLEPLLMALSRSPRGRQALVQTSENEVEDMELSIEVGSDESGGSAVNASATGPTTTRARGSSAGTHGPHSPLRTRGRVLPLLDVLLQAVRDSTAHSSAVDADAHFNPLATSSAAATATSAAAAFYTPLDVVCPVLIALLHDVRFGGWLVHTYREELSDERLAELARRTLAAAQNASHTGSNTSIYKHVAALRECIAAVRHESGGDGEAGGGGGEAASGELVEV